MANVDVNNVSFHEGLNENGYLAKGRLMWNASNYAHPPSIWEKLRVEYLQFYRWVYVNELHYL